MFTIQITNWFSKNKNKNVDGCRFWRWYTESMHDTRLLCVEDIHVPVPARVTRHHGRVVLFARRLCFWTSRKSTRNRSKCDLSSYSHITIVIFRGFQKQFSSKILKKFSLNQDVIIFVNEYFSGVDKFFLVGMKEIKDRLTKCIILKGDYIEI